MKQIAQDVDQGLHRTPEMIEEFKVQQKELAKMLILDVRT